MDSTTPHVVGSMCAFIGETCDTNTSTLLTFSKGAKAALMKSPRSILTSPFLFPLMAPANCLLKLICTGHRQKRWRVRGVTDATALIIAASASVIISGSETIYRREHRKVKAGGGHWGTCNTSQ